MNLLLKNVLIFSFYSILKFYKSFYYDVAAKFMIANFYKVPRIGKIIFTVSVIKGLRCETDIKITNALSVLDILLNKKASILFLEQKYLRKAKNLIFVCQTTFSHYFDFYLFLILLIKIIKPSLLKRYIYIKYRLLNDGFIFYIQDVSIIQELSADLKKEKINVKVSVFFTNTWSKSFFNFLIKYFRF